MFSKISGVISTISSIIGIYAFFNNSISLLCWCAVISIANSFIQVIFGEQNNLNTEILTAIIFLIISFFTKSPWFVIVAFGFCLADTILSVLGWIGMLIMLKGNKF